MVSISLIEINNGAYEMSMCIIYSLLSVDALLKELKKLDLTDMDYPTIKVNESKPWWQKLIGDFCKQL